MARTRARGRDVHFYLFSEPDKAIGGMKLNPSITEQIFLSMLDVLIVASGPYRVTLRTTGVDLPGHYDIRPYSCRAVTDEPCITRILSRTITGRDDFFRARVRERDGKCVITGIVNTEADDNIWRGFEATHVFPRSSEEYWVQNGFSRWITNRMGECDTGINSSQNGLLMQSTIHQKFDGFDFSINPDDGYKIICFDRDPFKIDGKILDPICRESNGEGVLANMRGAGELSFEMDFPPGSDMMGEILSGPQAAKRMEAELFSRLNGVSFA
ncbi:HNH endonuclease-domain-containing protein [Lipomyces tetrasporus]|uniref:HNH endonuclease-domain-containing protein n=1 Tax=Lipomyces tetrasporus TaxID=54092 RepID=A0AAD7QRS1_9ASCO|nr:HNH endonuclease-domain-containing protein [Lipomyces tetrasporus]KAJ8100051.1 HNH endonuclease-domain-containing protein [Lipomyces tetrasporus]